MKITNIMHQAQWYQYRSTNMNQNHSNHMNYWLPISINGYQYQLLVTNTNTDYWLTIPTPKPISIIGHQYRYQSLVTNTNQWLPIPINGYQYQSRQKIPISRKLEAALPDCRLVDISVATSSQRMVKSKEEIEVSSFSSS